MGYLPKGGLVKLKIEGFKKDDFTGTPRTIKVLINPENFKESYAIEYSKEQPAGTQGKPQRFYKVKPGEFTLNLLLDSTGIFPKKDDSSSLISDFQSQLSSLVPFQDVDASSDTGVNDDIKSLKEMLVSKEGTIHQPEYIKISYADIEKRCKITKMDIDYKMFNPQGYPIRVEVKLTCIETISDTLEKAKIAQSSPDLTHVRTVIEGDTLPLMTYKIYGNSKYYLEVAKANNLLNFRNLIPGQKIIFPPINKTQN